MLKSLEAQDALNELESYFLGDDFIIEDPVSISQANAIVVDEIKSKYGSYNNNPQDKWRLRHKKCIFCKYCSFTPGVIGHDPRLWCKVKQKIVRGRAPRHFCGAFTLIKD